MKHFEAGHIQSPTLPRTARPNAPGSKLLSLFTPHPSPAYLPTAINPAPVAPPRLTQKQMRIGRKRPPHEWGGTTNMQITLRMARHAGIGKGKNGHNRGVCIGGSMSRLGVYAVCGGAGRWP